MIYHTLPMETILHTPLGSWLCDVLMFVMLAAMSPFGLEPTSNLRDSQIQICSCVMFE